MIDNQKHFYYDVVNSSLPWDFSSSALPPDAGSSDTPDGGCWSFGDHLSWGREQLARAVRFVELSLKLWVLWR